MLLLKGQAGKDMKFGKRQVCKRKSLRNRATLCVLLAVALLLYHDPFLLLWWPQEPPQKTGGLPLDMSTDSIDDMYDGCRSETAAVIDLFGVFEWHFNRNFSTAWASAGSHAKKHAHTQLKGEHATVIYMYTKMKDIQKVFNQAVKTGKRKYSTNRFKFHYFYFYLTDAIRVLRHNQTTCRTTYHRTWRHFERRVINTNVRFGAFTWVASRKKSSPLNGNVSCFEIYTCFGADITHYSATKEMGQVLIPPYEVFRVTDVLTNDPWCRVVYKLQSTKTPRTVLNCKLHQMQMNSYFEAVSMHWKTSSVGKMSACIMLLVYVSVVLVKRKQKRFVAAVMCALQPLLMILVIWRLIS